MVGPCYPGARPTGPPPRSEREAIRDDGAMRDGGAAIEVCNLSHTFRSAAGSVRVLDDLDLQVPPGGYVALQGSSGAGKSTLLSILGGLERPQAGRALVDGVDLGELGGDDLAAFRRRTVGFVFQHFGLLDPLTAM